LEGKGAVRPTGEEPRRYRPVAPDALFARIVNQESRALDALEASLAESPADRSAELLRLTGQRSVEELVLRSAVRSKDAVECLGSAAFLERLAPAWHKRAADGADTRLWVVGDGGHTLPIRPSARLDADPLVSRFGGVPILFCSSLVAIAAVIPQPGGDVHGYWGNDSLFLGLTRAALRSATP
jgi:sugar-specific transcriptional regulator TrmB